MSATGLKSVLLNRLRAFREDMRATMSVELVLVFPILFWAYLAMMIFFDAYRARMESQAAALHVADLISRQTDMITDDYLEGLNDVYDFLTARERDTRLRVSSVYWDPDQDDLMIAWSYGTRGLPSLLELSGILSELNDWGNNGGNDGTLPPLLAGAGFGNISNIIPRLDLAQRIPMVLPGEALIMVEAFTIWDSPVRRWMGMNFLNDTRLTPIAVTRPRFSPFIRYEHDNVIFPGGLPEINPPVGEPEGPPDPEPDPDPEPPTNVVTVVDTDFSDGNTDGWSQSNITDSTNAGSFLGPFGNETVANPVTYSVNLGETSNSAVIEFDLFVIDSWDGYSTQWSNPSGEVLIITVNGTAISVTPFRHNQGGYYGQPRSHVFSRAEGRFTTTMERIAWGSNIWGSSFTDEVWRVQIEIENPATEFTLGFIGDLDEGINNESFGFQNFRVEAERGAHDEPHYVPASAYLGSDIYTRVEIYAGCPDIQIGTKTHSLRADHLNSYPIRHRVRTRGQQQWRYCQGLNVPNNGAFRGDATPSLVMHWDNMGLTGTNTRLRIRTEDENNGRTCDGTLLIRTPTGQWLFNDDFWGWNAGRELGNAISGEYHIYLGRYGGGSCDLDVIFETY